jgi:predicted nuclease with RNAse H fold
MQMFGLTGNFVINIDLTGNPEDSTGLAASKKRIVKTSLIHMDEELPERIAYCNPAVIAIDAPFNFRKKGIPEEQRERISKGYRVLPQLSQKWQNSRFEPSD